MSSENEMSQYHKQFCICGPSGFQCRKRSFWDQYSLQCKVLSTATLVEEVKPEKDDSEQQKFQKQQHSDFPGLSGLNATNISINFMSEGQPKENVLEWNLEAKKFNT